MSLHNASVAVFDQMLTALSGLLDKAKTGAEAKKYDPEILFQARLYPDMFCFGKQVQVACDFALRGACRLAGADVPNWPHEETTLAGVKQRIAKTLDHVKKLDKAAIDGAGARDIIFPMRDEKVTMTGADYLTRFCLPHFYFHVTCAYALLRHNGIEIGKGDYMGNWRG
jgi:hypothetical protein